MLFNLPTLVLLICLGIGAAIAAPVLIKGFMRRGKGVKYEQSFLLQRAPQLMSVFTIFLLVIGYALPIAAQPPRPLGGSCPHSPPRQALFPRETVPSRSLIPSLKPPLARSPPPRARPPPSCARPASPPRPPSPSSTLQVARLSRAVFCRLQVARLSRAVSIRLLLLSFLLLLPLQHHHTQPETLTHGLHPPVQSPRHPRAPHSHALQKRSTPSSATSSHPLPASPHEPARHPLPALLHSGGGSWRTGGKAAALESRAT